MNAQFDLERPHVGYAVLPGFLRNYPFTQIEYLINSVLFLGTNDKYEFKSNQHFITVTFRNGESTTKKRI